MKARYVMPMVGYLALSLIAPLLVVLHMFFTQDNPEMSFLKGLGCISFYGFLQGLNRAKHIQFDGKEVRLSQYWVEGGLHLILAIFLLGVLDDDTSGLVVTAWLLSSFILVSQAMKRIGYCVSSILRARSEKRKEAERRAEAAQLEREIDDALEEVFISITKDRDALMDELNEL